MAPVSDGPVTAAQGLPAHLSVRGALATHWTHDFEEHLATTPAE